MPTWKIWINFPYGRIAFFVQSWDMGGAQMLGNLLAAKLGGFFDTLVEGPL